jgi:hypothetical protein
VSHLSWQGGETQQTGRRLRVLQRRRSHRSLRRTYRQARALDRRRVTERADRLTRGGYSRSSSGETFVQPVVGFQVASVHSIAE